MSMLIFRSFRILSVENPVASASANVSQLVPFVVN